MKSIKKIFENAVLLVLGAAIAVLFLEYVLRFTEWRSVLTFLDIKWTASVKGRTVSYFKRDSEAGFDIQENFPVTRGRIEQTFPWEIWSNELGCFDEPYRGEKDYILLAGDSLTFGLVPFRDNFGALINDLLDYRVLKCGVICYGIKQELLKTKKIIAKVGRSPRLIIVCFYPNDLLDDYLFPFITEREGRLVTIKRLADFKTGETKQFLEQGVQKIRRLQGLSFFKIKFWLMQHSICYHIVNTVIIKMKNTPVYQKAFLFGQAEQNPPTHVFPDLAFWPPGKYPWIGRAWDILFDSFRDFKTLAQKNNARLLIVLSPTKWQVYPFFQDYADLDREQPNKILRAFFEKEQIDYIDLLSPFREYADKRAKRRLDSVKDLYYSSEFHWNSRGNRLAGLLISERILEKGLVPVNDRDRKLRQVKDYLKRFK